MFDTFFYNPIYNLIIFLSNYLVDFGTVIIISTIIIKFLIYPLYSGQIKNQIATKKAQPELKEIQEKLKDKKLSQFQRQELMMKMMAVNKKYGVKILTPLISLIVQMMVIMALYWIIYRSGFPKINTDLLYSFVHSTKEHLSMNFLGWFDLTKPSWILGLLAGITQFIHMEISMPDIHWSDLKKSGKDTKEDMMKSFQVYMKYGFPLMAVLLLTFTLNAAIGLYWVTSNIFMIFQERAIRGKKKELKEIED